MTSVRLCQLRLEPWGCFEDRRLDFGEVGALDLVLGPNAAGKSTMTRGIAGLLFGIEARSHDNHTFDYADLRIGSKISIAGETVDVVRRKGRTGTLLGPDGEALPDDYLDGALGGLRREVFESLLLVNNAALKEGGAELLQGKGEVGASLFAAAAGIASLHTTIEGLDSRAREFFNPRGRKDALHDALRDLREAEKQLREVTLRPQKHKRMETEVRRLKDESEKIAGQIRDFLVERVDLERRRRVAPLIRRHGELAERLARLDGTPDLPPESRERRTSAENSLRGAESVLKRAEEKRDALAAEIESCDVDEELIARREEIEAVGNESSAVLKGVKDRPRLEREKMEANEKLLAASDAAGVDASEMEALRRPPAVQGRLDAAVTRHGLLVERRRAALEASDDAQKASVQAEAILAEHSEMCDPAGLAASVKAARELGPVDRQMADVRAEIERVGEAAGSAFERISPRLASIKDLVALAVPGVGEVEAVLARGAAFDQDERDLATDRERLGTRKTEVAALEDEIELGRAVPGPAALADARGERQKSWVSLRETLEAGRSPTTDELDEHQNRVASADSIVDQQLEGTVELARATRLELDRRALVREEKRLAERAEDIARGRAELGDSWSQLWSEVELDAPPAPEAALDWLRRREEIVDILGARTAKKATMKSLTEQVERHRSSIEEQLARFDVRPGDVTFSELLQIADAKVEEAGAGRREREGLQRGVADAQRRLTQAKTDVEDAEAALASWKEEWPDVLVAVGLPEQTTPEVATTISRSISEGLEHLGRRQELERRIVGIDRDRSAYAASVETLVADLAEDLEGSEPTKAAALLGSRLDKSLQEAAVRETLIRQRASLDEEAVSAEESLLAARQEIEAVLSAAGCEELDDLPELEDRSAEARDLRRQLGELEERAVEAGERRFDELSKEISGLDVAALEGRLAEIEGESEALGEKRDELRGEVGARESELRSAEQDTAAVELREDIELIKGEIRTLVNDYANARLGSVVVRRTMERYRKLHENPLLTRANKLFARITLGDFVELMVDYDDRDGAILVGRQRDGKRKRVEEMSSGTREQLFLALRIAAIERYVATTVAAPVIFDDAFLESDDDRSEKIFESLAELAAMTQVIVLTHRRQQAELGERILGKGVSVIELESQAPPRLRAAA